MSFCFAPTGYSDEMDVNLYSSALGLIAALPSAETSIPKTELDDCFCNCLYLITVSTASIHLNEMTIH